MRVAMPKINRDTLGRFLLVVPPLEVQAKLIASYTAERLGTGGLVDMIGLSITRLREQRTSLITAAVTGQLDISAWSKRGETERRIESVEAAV